MLQTPEENQA